MSLFEFDKAHPVNELEVMKWVKERNRILQATVCDPELMKYIYFVIVQLLAFPNEMIRTGTNRNDSKNKTNDCSSGEKSSKDSIFS